MSYNHFPDTNTDNNVLSFQFCSSFLFFFSFRLIELMMQVRKIIKYNAHFTLWRRRSWMFRERSMIVIIHVTRCSIISPLCFSAERCKNFARSNEQYLKIQTQLWLMSYYKCSNNGHHVNKSIPTTIYFLRLNLSYIEVGSLVTIYKLSEWWWTLQLTVLLSLKDWSGWTSGWETPHMRWDRPVISLETQASMESHTKKARDESNDSV